MAICDSKMVGLFISTVNDTAPQSSPFLNLSGAPASTDVGLCAVDADVSIWNVLPSVQNAGEFRKM